MIRSFECTKIIGHSFKTLAGLTGILGIHKYVDLFDQQYCKNYKISASKDRKVIDIVFETIYLKRFAVRIDFRQMRLFDLILESTGRKEGISFLILKNQVTNAKNKKFQFKRITVQASRNDKKESLKIGYILWGKYGFIPNSNDFNDVLKIIKSYDSSLNTLEDLLSTPAGLDYWLQNGKSWNGDFNLDDTSESMSIFERVREKKGL